MEQTEKKNEMNILTYHCMVIPIKSRMILLETRIMVQHWTTFITLHDTFKLH